MPYNLKMFDSKEKIIVVPVDGNASVISHCHNFIELVYVTEGKAVHHFIKNGISKEIEIQKGNLFLITDEKISHSIQPIFSGDNLLLTNIIFPSDIFDFDFSKFSPEIIFDINEIENCKHYIDLISKEFLDKKKYHEQFVKGTVYCLITQIFRALDKKKNKNIKVKQTQSQAIMSYVNKATEYIENNFDKKITVDDIVSHCGLCKAHLQRLMKKERNVTILGTLNNYRIERACVLLMSTSLTVSSISEMVGFFDLKYFYKKFKEITNCTPMEYREKANKIYANKK